MTWSPCAYPTRSASPPWPRPAYLARRGRPQRPEDLAGHDCIRIRLPSGATLPWTFDRGGERLEIAVGGPLVVNHEWLAIRAMRDGVGLGQFPLEMVADEIAAGRLETVLDDCAAVAAGLFLYYPSRRQIPAPLRAFVERLQADLRERRSSP
ncbi:MAG: LysR substrate-binding domain-containing protein [Caulobacteraceae bacterium]